jgi:hypothetical protein
MARAALSLSASRRLAGDRWLPAWLRLLFAAKQLFAGFLDETEKTHKNSSVSWFGQMPGCTRFV